MSKSTPGYSIQILSIFTLKGLILDSFIQFKNSREDDYEVREVFKS